MLTNSFRLPEAKAVRYLTEGTPIVHVHGKLGELPFVPSPDARPYRRSADAQLVSDALAVRDSIKIVSEGAANDPEFGRARKLISEAEVICFLGFRLPAEERRAFGSGKSRARRNALGVSQRR